MIQPIPTIVFLATSVALGPAPHSGGWQPQRQAARLRATARALSLMTRCSEAYRRLRSFSARMVAAEPATGARSVTDVAFFRPNLVEATVHGTGGDVRAICDGHSIFVYRVADETRYTRVRAPGNRVAVAITLEQANSEAWFSPVFLSGSGLGWSGGVPIGSVTRGSASHGQAPLEVATSFVLDDGKPWRTVMTIGERDHLLRSVRTTTPGTHAVHIELLPQRFFRVNAAVDPRMFEFAPVRGARQVRNLWPGP